MNNQDPANSWPPASYRATVRLLEADPDIGRFLSSGERAQALTLTVPVRTVEKGDLHISELLDRSDSFGALVLDGMLLTQVQVGDHVAARLLGPGDLVSALGTPPSILIAHSHCRATVATQFALLGSAASLGARRWPGILAGLYTRIGEQCDRVATQLAVCQLPRVEERLLALLWLLAESWGQVTPAGTTLPLALTHDVLGALIGARRPTVTLALGQLSERGAILQQDGAWLLLQPPPQPTRSAPEIVDPTVIDRPPSPWGDAAWPVADREDEWRELSETVARLRDQHARQKQRMREQMSRLRTIRSGSRLTRERAAKQSLRRRRAPS